MPKPKMTHRLLSVAITLVVVAMAGYFFENFKNWLPWLTELQLRSYNWISRLEAREPRAQWIIPVEIDDRTFYDVLKLGSGEVTDRRALADLIRSATASNAAVIALDIDLGKEHPDETEPRMSANAALLAAIREALGKGIPVILTCSFSNSGTQIPNIFDDSELPRVGELAVANRARIGFDHAAKDLRKVPLVVDRKTRLGAEREYSSFALETVDAYEGTLGISPRTKERLNKQISEREFVYTTFLRPEQFPHVSAAALLEKKGEAEKILSHRIVLIGGNRHVRQGGDKWLDIHSLPPLTMTGMYFQANYVEGLLDNRVKTVIPGWAASAVDLVLGALMIFFSGKVKSLGSRLQLLSIFFVPVVIAYISSVNLGYVLDFVLPLLLLFLHAILDHYAHLRHLAQMGREPG